MSEKNITMQMIADQLGITKVSVSKALNNQPGVSEQLKKKILEVSYKMGYTKNKNDGKVSNIKKLGFLLPKRFFIESESFYTIIYYYLSKQCAFQNINLVLYIISSHDEENLAFPFSLEQDKIDGLFIAGEVANTYIHSVLNFNIPIVAIDFYMPNMTIDSIVTDNFYASYLATMYLINKGHKDIGFVGNPNYTSSIMDRHYGYLKALNQNNLIYNKDWHIINNDLYGIYTHDYNLPGTLPTAFVCHCDMAAYQLMLKLQSQGVAIPDQVSLVSFDNTELSSNCIPKLTTVDINKKEIASKSFQQMLWRISHLQLEPQRSFLSTNLIERESVKNLL